MAACSGQASDEPSNPTAVPVQTNPNTTTAPTSKPVLRPTVDLGLGNIPVQATAIAAPTIIPTNTVVAVAPQSTSTAISIATSEPKTDGESNRVAEEGDSIAVHYTGTLDSGEVFDTSKDGDPPLEFVIGAGQMISGFDAAVRGMAVGEVKTVQLAPGDAYGEKDEQLILSMPKEGAPENLSVGDTARLGNGRPVVVVEITDEAIVVDANHRLAGETLTFEIEVVSIN